MSKSALVLLALLVCYNITVRKSTDTYTQRYTEPHAGTLIPTLTDFQSLFIISVCKWCVCLYMYAFRTIPEAIPIQKRSYVVPFSQNSNNTLITAYARIVYRMSILLLQTIVNIFLVRSCYRIDDAKQQLLYLSNTIVCSVPYTGQDYMNVYGGKGPKRTMGSTKGRLHSFWTNETRVTYVGWDFWLAISTGRWLQYI